MGVPRLVALLAAATVAAVAAAMALPAPVTADEVHVRSVSSVRLPLTSSIDINLRVYGAGRGDADGRLRRAREAFEAAVAAVEGLPAGAIARRRNEVSQNSDGCVMKVGGGARKGGRDENGGWTGGWGGRGGEGGGEWGREGCWGCGGGERRARRAASLRHTATPLPAPSLLIVWWRGGGGT